MRLTLPVIVIAQAFCTSLWFAGNAVISDIALSLQAAPNFIAHLTTAIQSGFIVGTFIFALLAVADRFSPSLVFFLSALLAGIFNLGIALLPIDVLGLLFLRFLTGFFLAGIYPVGMKIAADHFGPRLGKALGFLVGALVLGTAAPHLLKTTFSNLPWQYVLYSTTALSMIGGLLLFLLVPDGPFRQRAQALKSTAFLQGFRNKAFRSVAFGYFGHMWELYAFWTFVPLMIVNYNKLYPQHKLSPSGGSFIVIGLGALACVGSGLLSQRFGAKNIAVTALSLSFLCCVLSPWFLYSSSVHLFMAFLIFWGMMVIADSPLFSTLVAQNAPVESKGTALTIVNCIGFAITIISIQCISLLYAFLSEQYVFIFLAVGPVLGLMALLRNRQRKIAISLL